MCFYFYFIFIFGVYHTGEGALQIHLITALLHILRKELKSLRELAKQLFDNSFCCLDLTSAGGGRQKPTLGQPIQE